MSEIIITVLIDNRLPVYGDFLHCEHGLSFLIECKGIRVLCDMGASGLFLQNAQTLGADLKNIDFAVLSHGHTDHTGGLADFLQYNDRAKVYLSDQIPGRHFYSSRQGGKHDISTDQTLFDGRFADRFVFVSESRWLHPQMALVFSRPADGSPSGQLRYQMPYANRFLTSSTNPGGLDYPDDFAHEMSLVFKTDEGLVIVSSCSHSGALNIINACRHFCGDNRVYAFVGGLHFVDHEQTDAEVADFLRVKKQICPDTLFYTGHCTGAQAMEYLKEDPTVRFFHTGSKILI